MLQQEPYGPMPSLGCLTLVAVRPFGHLPTDEFLDVGLLERCQSDALLNQERIKRLAVDYVLTNCTRLVSTFPKKLFKVAQVRANNRSCKFHPLPPFRPPDGGGTIHTY